LVVEMDLLERNIKKGEEEARKEEGRKEEEEETQEPQQGLSLSLANGSARYVFTQPFSGSLLLLARAPSGIERGTPGSSCSVG
jgi:hypothetical protein